MKTGVVAGEGYTLEDNTATAAGSYTATVTLADPANTVWADDAAAPTATITAATATALRTRLSCRIPVFSFLFIVSPFSGSHA